ncbi:MAG: ClbS/DfsB family four-helix bundle protein [Chloroflexi bacterium]|nr:ClbS/DfsB family four-helix bundle protein [Chloroflexota bacterium]
MKNSVTTVAAQIEMEVNQATPLLLSLTGSGAGYTPGSNQWSKKMILGHLIDSAANNHQRFVRTAQESGISFPAYDQEFWVQAQYYQEADWAELVELWRRYNQHLAFIIRRIPETALTHECVVGDKAPATLAWLISDYLDHLKHHLNDVLKPSTKGELLAQIEQERAALEQMLSRLSEAQLLTPNPDSGWTIKDHLAHLGAWEVGIAALLQRRPRWEAMGLDEATVASHETDDLNALIYRQHQGRPLAEVLAYFQDTHRQMLAALDRLTDEELFKPYDYYEGGEAGDDDTRPIIGWIISNTYEHYAEHQGWIEAIL